MSLQIYLEDRQKCIARQEEILNTAKKEKRNMSVDEKSEFDKLDTEIVNIENTIESMKKFKDNQNKEIVNGTKVTSFIEKTQDKKDDKYDFGRFMQAAAVKGGARINSNVNLDILNAATGHSANVPSEGGLLISPTRSSEIMQKMYEGGEILRRCQIFDIGEGSDSLEVPYVDETSRADGSRWGGLRAYREGEVDSPTSTKTKLGLWECRVSDLKAIVYVTERLLNDAAALQSLIESQMAQEFTFKTEDELLNGTGGIQCKGIIGDPGTVSVAKETGQATTTIVAKNIIKMYTRCWGRARMNAAWFINQDIEPELFTMSLNVGTGGVPLFMPANGLSSDPYNTLMGKPIIPAEQCQTLGTVGDIILGNFSEYAMVRKGGLNQASSIHVRFIYDEMCFKFNMRNNGKPKWKSALTPKNSTSTLAPFVTLASR